MKASQFDAAVCKYNDAIKLNRDPAYFCNRLDFLIFIICYCLSNLLVKHIHLLRCIKFQYITGPFFSAAAYCRLEQYDLAIQDCRTALALDPKYSKAYGRMGYFFELF